MPSHHRVLRALRQAMFIPLVGAGSGLATPTLAQDDSNRIRVEYVAPQNTAHQSLYEILKERRALEKLQEIFSPFKLPIDLILRTTGCGGVVNAWYQRPVVTVCYEYLDEIRQTMPNVMTPAGVTPTDAVLGQFFYVFAHEIGHAVFDLLDVPLFGRGEDAADQFATYIMLQFGKDEARRLIAGAAYSYKGAVQSSTVTEPLATYSDAHGIPAQRFFNLLCIAYGSDTTLFADLVEKQYLPKKRASGCRREYGEVTFAFQKLIVPHLDLTIAKQVMSMPVPLVTAQSPAT